MMMMIKRQNTLTLWSHHSILLQHTYPMAFPDQDMPPLQHFSQSQQHPLPLNSPLLRPQSSSDAKPTNPTWLNTPHFSSNFLNLHTNTDSSSSNHWLSPVPNDSIISHESAEFSNRTKNDCGLNDDKDFTESGSAGEMAVNWQTARYKTQILSHPLYDQLLSAHVACLRIATPVDQLSRIDAQLALSEQVVAKYSALGQGNLGDDKELDQFMVTTFLCRLYFAFPDS